MRIQNAVVLNDDGALCRRELSVTGEVFGDNPAGEVVDAGGCYALPGLIDIHFHGCVGYDFCDGTHEALAAMGDYLARSGVTAATPASMTLPEERLVSIYENFRDYKGAGTMFCGINMEGPFFCEAKKGAQNADYLRSPDIGLFRRLQTACGDGIKLVDLAPELPGAAPFIQAASRETAVSLAHSTADYDQAMAAFQLGARHVTHLFNAMPPFHHRDPGIVGAAADSGATVELICDGIHIHPAVVRATLRLFGPEKVVLVSDSMMATGLCDGAYELGGQPVSVTGNRATLKDGTIAGSATNLYDCMRRAVDFGVPLETAVAMASRNPARVIGESHRMGSITPGKLANFILADKDLRIQAVYMKGQKIV